MYVNKMFEDTLLIIKSDYMMKRKPLLKYLLGCGFQIQGHRKIFFTPELAAEFYQGQTDEPNFMMLVIMLTKDNCEAFILAKENAIEDLLNTMVCYFGTSVEMERNIHVTQCARRVRREISFIFPNYIHEPIHCPDQLKFCTNNPVMESLVDELYDIVVNKDVEPTKNWKIKLSEFFERSNRALPIITNMCARTPLPHLQEQAQQTIETLFKYPKGGFGSESPHSTDTTYTTLGSSLNVSTSSCMSCSQFGSVDVCIQQKRPSAVLVELIKAKTAPLSVSPISSSSPCTSDREVKEKVPKDLPELVKVEKTITEEESLSIEEGIPLVAPVDKSFATMPSEEMIKKAELQSEQPTTLQTTIDSGSDVSITDINTEKDKGLPVQTTIDETEDVRKDNDGDVIIVENPIEVIEIKDNDEDQVQPPTITIQEESTKEETSKEPLPIAAAPVESVPVESAPVESAPVESTPVESTPVESTPAESAPQEPITVE